MTYISEEVQGQVLALAAREKALFRLGMRLSQVFLGFAVAALGTGLLARFLGPDTQPLGIDVPAQVLEHFSVSMTNGAFSEIYSWISGICPILATISIILGIANAVMNQKIVPLISSIVMSVVLNLLPNMVNSIMLDSDLLVAKKHTFEVVVNSLQEVGQDATPAGLYVLAQVALTQDKPKFINTDLVDKITSPAAGFTPKGEALYAIEYAAYGTAKSPAAVAYRDECLSRQEWAKGGAIILGSLSVVISGVLLGILVLHRVIFRRVRRICCLLELKEAS